MDEVIGIHDWESDPCGFLNNGTTSVKQSDKIKLYGIWLPPFGKDDKVFLGFIKANSWESACEKVVNDKLDPSLFNKETNRYNGEQLWIDGNCHEISITERLYDSPPIVRHCFFKPKTECDCKICLEYKSLIK